MILISEFTNSEIRIILISEFINSEIRLTSIFRFFARSQQGFQDFISKNLFDQSHFRQTFTTLTTYEFTLALKLRLIALAEYIRISVLRVSRLRKSRIIFEGIRAWRFFPSKIRGEWLQSHICSSQRSHSPLTQSKVTLQSESCRVVITVTPEARVCH